MISDAGADLNPSLPDVLMLLFIDAHPPWIPRKLEADPVCEFRGGFSGGGKTEPSPEGKDMWTKRRNQRRTSKQRNPGCGTKGPPGSLSGSSISLSMAGAWGARGGEVRPGLSGARVHPGLGCHGESLTVVLQAVRSHWPQLGRTQA